VEDVVENEDEDEEEEAPRKKVIGKIDFSFLGIGGDSSTLTPCKFREFHSYYWELMYSNTDTGRNPDALNKCSLLLESKIS
jgi:hypothetical protein